VTCPYLLSIKCGNCGKNGHTPRYCKEKKGFAVSVPVEKKKFVVPVPVPVPVVEKKVQFSNVGLKSNRFLTLASLCSDVGVDLVDVVDDWGVPSVASIVWGVGFHSNLEKSWADKCFC